MIQGDLGVCQCHQPSNDAASRKEGRKAIYNMGSDKYLGSSC